MSHPQRILKADLYDTAITMLRDRMAFRKSKGTKFEKALTAILKGGLLAELLLLLALLLSSPSLPMLGVIAMFAIGSGLILGTFENAEKPNISKARTLKHLQNNPDVLSRTLPVEIRPPR